MSDMAQSDADIREHLARIDEILANTSKLPEILKAFGVSQ